MYKYAVYKASGGNARVKTGREEIYVTRGEKALYAIADTYLADIIWALKMSWKNDTDAPQTLTRLGWRSLGSEVNNEFSLGASFKGVGITVDHSENGFGIDLNHGIEDDHDELNVLPPSRIIFYQKRYKFRKIDVFHSRPLGGKSTAKIK
jgi:hypothetical protein